MSSHPRALVVDDERHILQMMGLCLESAGFETVLQSDPVAAVEAIKRHTPDLAFFDLKMEPIGGLELLRETRSAVPTVTVVMITAYGTIESAVEAIRNGAYTYLQKPFDCEELQIQAQKAWEYHTLQREVATLRTMLADLSDNGTSIITRNRAMRELLELAEKIGPSNLSVLIEGESGTGKELLAEYIHNKSLRRGKPMIRVNCGAIPESIIESELFGHVKGAFTGAVKDRKGRFELADGGTIFLDEVLELPPAAQVKLLRVLQQKEYQRVGESQSRTTDVRVIAATNKDTEAALRAGAFREDLFYRINGIRMKLPPLRERPEDIPLLIQHFLQARHSTRKPPVEIELEAQRAMQRYHWPGNIRELENVLERAVLLAGGGPVRLAHLPDEVRAAAGTPSPVLSLEEMEKVHIQRVLEQTGNLEEAAAILHIDPATLWRKRKKYNL